MSIVSKALALAGVLLSASANPQTLPTAKFPKDNAALVQWVGDINRSVNSTIKYTPDNQQYGRDLWVMLPKNNKGDCEDFALTKIARLQDGGFDVLRNTKLVGVIVHIKTGATDGHAILAVRLPSGAVAYMDNMYRDLMTRDELVSAGYEFSDWRG